jgi:hypothetical protein
MRTLPPRVSNKILIEPNSGCWLWTAALSQAGYGRIFFDGENRMAPRVVYELLKGPIPEKLFLDHLCRTRCCVNPNHLEPVTNRENCLRGENRNRNKTHCIHGHLFNDENTYICAWKGRTWRMCKTCQLIRNQFIRKRKYIENPAKTIDRPRWPETEPGISDPDKTNRP